MQPLTIMQIWVAEYNLINHRGHKVGTKNTKTLFCKFTLCDLCVKLRDLCG